MADKAVLISEPPVKPKRKFGGAQEDAGRPRIEIDWNIVDQMLMAGLDGKTIAHRLGVHYDTFHNRGIQDGKWGPDHLDFPDFSNYKASRLALGDDTLLERQYIMANGQYSKEERRWIIYPNVSMLKWLGMQRLGQSENHQLKDPNDKPLELPAAQVTIIEQP